MHSFSLASRINSPLRFRPSFILPSFLPSFFSILLAYSRPSVRPSGSLLSSHRVKLLVKRPPLPLQARGHGTCANNLLGRRPYPSNRTGYHNLCLAQIRHPNSAWRRRHAYEKAFRLKLGQSVSQGRERRAYADILPAGDVLCILAIRNGKESPKAIQL